MRKIYILDNNEIETLRGIIEETLNRKNLTDDEVRDYWNKLDESNREDADEFGMDNKHVRGYIIDDLEENFPKF